MGERRGVDGRKGKGGEGGREGEGEGRGGERGENVEGPGKWSAPGPVLALGGPGLGAYLLLSPVSNSQRISKSMNICQSYA